MFHRDFAPSAPPDAVHPLDVHQPAGGIWQRRNSTIAIASGVLSRINDVARQLVARESWEQRVDVVLRCGRSVYRGAVEEEFAGADFVGAEETRRRTRYAALAGLLAAVAALARLKGIGLEFAAQQHPPEKSADFVNEWGKSLIKEI